MNKPTKEHLEAVSNLLQACRLCGASFKTGMTSAITMSDGTVIRIEDEHEELWTIWSFGFGERFLRKCGSVWEIQIGLLSFHLEILRKSSCEAPTVG